MYITKQTYSTSARTPERRRLTQGLQDLSSSIQRFAADFSWAYRAAFPNPAVGYQRRGRFVLRTLLCLQSSAVWYRYLKASYLHGFALEEPGLVEAVHRPFFDKNITSCARAILLKDHFELFRSLFGMQKSHQILQGNSISLCQLSGKDEEKFEIKLFRADAFKREGGVTLELSMNDSPLLYLTFTLVKTNSGLMIKVGGIQSKGTHCHALAKEATHALHGIQPRLLLIDAVRTIAQQLDCIKIECISKENHIYQSWRYRFKKNIQAEYNQLWTLAGADQNKDGNFDLPITVEQKSIEMRPSKKRSEYRRRQVLTDAMKQQIGDSILYESEYARASSMDKPMLKAA